MSDKTGADLLRGIARGAAGPCQDYRCQDETMFQCRACEKAQMIRKVIRDVVRECAGAAAGRIQDVNVDDGEPTMEDLAGMARDAVLEHFGVDEGA